MEIASTTGTSTFDGNVRIKKNLQVDGNFFAPVQLQLSGFTQGSALFVGPSGTVAQNNSQFFWDNTNNRLGIGTSTPAAKLQVNGTSYFGDVGTAGTFRLYGSDSSPGSTGSYVQFTNTAGKLDITGGNGSASTENTIQFTGGVQPGIDDTYTLGTASLRFKAIKIGTNDSTFAGNVGVGQISPSYRLSVAGASGFLGEFRETTSANSSDLLFNVSSGVAKIYSSYSGTGVNSDLAFVTTQSGGSQQEGMRILGSNGYIGIKNTSPSALLEVGSNTTTDTGLYVHGGDGGSGTTVANFMTYGGATALFVRGNGAVGIGTVTPGAPLEIVTPTGATFENAIRLTKAGGYGETNIQNYYSSPSNYGLAINVAGAGTPQMVIDNSGFVGIGTNSPVDALVVVGTTNNTGFEFGNTTTNLASLQIYDRVASAYRQFRTNALSYIWNVNGVSTGMVMDSTGKVGIGTTSPYANLSIQSGASTGDAFAVATSSGAAVFGVDNDGHNWTSGSAGAVSVCGTGSGSVVGDDQTGTITTATAATACTYTFAKAYRKTPVCTVTDDSLVGFADIAAISTTAVTFGISSALTGGHLYYSCRYHQ